MEFFMWIKWINMSGQPERGDANKSEIRHQTLAI